MKINKKQELPEILYESPSYPGEETSPFPYIESNKNDEMPVSLFIFEYFDTGETEPDHNGKPAMIVDQIPHHYVDMAVLKKILTASELNRVRKELGMEPLKEAKKAGQEIINKVMAKEKELTEQAMSSQDERIDAHKQALENQRKKMEN